MCLFLFCGVAMQCLGRYWNIDMYGIFLASVALYCTPREERKEWGRATEREGETCGEFNAIETSLLLKERIKNKSNVGCTWKPAALLKVIKCFCYCLLINGATQANKHTHTAGLRKGEWGDSMCMCVCVSDVCNLHVHCIDKIALPGHQSLHLEAERKCVTVGLKFNTHACVTQHTALSVCVSVCLPVCFVYILVLFDLIFFLFEVGENAATTRGVADATATKNVTDA